MSFKPVLGDFQSSKGGTETIQIVPSGPGTTINIWSVLYGSGTNGPAAIALNADQASFDMRVLAGSNNLQVVLVSASNTRQTVVAQQSFGGTVNILEDDIHVVNGLGAWNIEIKGV